MTNWQSDSRDLTMLARCSGASSNNPRAIFSRNVTTIRENKGLTQEALGWASSLHQFEIARVERGTCNPGLEAIVKIARSLEVPAADLLRGL